MTNGLAITPRISIPSHELKFTFVRSSGPGGQNVNKVSSKAVLRWEVAATQSLSDEVRMRFLARYRRRITPEGSLVISSQRYRSQARNVQDCLDKLRALVLASLVPPKVRKPTRPTKAAAQRRLQEKRKSSSKKLERQTRYQAEDG